MPTFDIFSGWHDKNAVWIEAVEGLAEARARMDQIAAEKPGRYFIFSTASHAVLAIRHTFPKLESKEKSKGSAA